MSNTKPELRLKLTCAALMLLLSACASAPSSSPLPPVEPARVPALPAAAKQPAPPPICLPTCSAGLTRLRVTLADTPIRLGSPASSASAPMKP